MGENKKCNFDSMIELIGELKEINARINNVKEQVAFLKESTVIGEVINFPSNDIERYFGGITRNIDDIIVLEDDVIRAKEVSEKIVDLKFEIGEIVISTGDIRLKTLKDNQYNRVLDVNGNYYFGENNKFAIYDLVGNDFVMKCLSSGRGYGTFLVNKNLIGVFFEKSGTQKMESLRKVEFVINGIKQEFFGDLDEVRVFEENAGERKDNSWSFGLNYTRKTTDVIKSYDEIFGLSVSVYFDRERDINLQDIIFYFSDNFAVGFSKCKHEKDIYKYNGKISYFTKESGANGTHYFPKDVFEGTLKNRIVNVIGDSKVVLESSNT